MMTILMLATMLSDLMLIFFVAFIWKEDPGILSLILTILVYKVWRATGSFDAWIDCYRRLTEKEFTI